MDTTERIIDTPTDDGEMAVLVSEPSGGRDDGATWPVVLLFIDAPGIRDATHRFAAKLAGEGYRVVTPDLHHRHGRLLNAMDTMPPGAQTTQEMVWGWIASMTDAQIQHDADCALAALDVDSSTPIATIGFCLGARAVVRRMLAEPDRVVAGAGWHPSFLADGEDDSPHRSADRIEQPLYLAIGSADTVQSVEMHQPFLDVVEPMDDVTVEIYDGADHGFTWPSAPNYHEAAATGAWTATTKMFADAFG